MPKGIEEEKANIFLKMIKRSLRGHLKIYLGYCAGVGKTYRMLQEAQSMKKEGIDVVVGFVETYGRAETEKLLEGLEMIPRIVFEYRGIKGGRNGCRFGPEKKTGSGIDRRACPYKRAWQQK